MRIESRLPMGFVNRTPIGAHLLEAQLLRHIRLPFGMSAACVARQV
jgi:hypothetical protein